MENIDDMEVQILLSKTDSFNSIYLKDLVRASLSFLLEALDFASSR